MDACAGYEIVSSFQGLNLRQAPMVYASDWRNSHMNIIFVYKGNDLDTNLPIAGFQKLTKLWHKPLARVISLSILSKLHFLVHSKQKHLYLCKSHGDVFLLLFWGKNQGRDKFRGIRAEGGNDKWDVEC